MTDEVTPIGLPKTTRSVKEALGAAANVGATNVVVLMETEKEGVIALLADERNDDGMMDAKTLNWILDRAKSVLHRDD